MVRILRVVFFNKTQLLAVPLPTQAYECYKVPTNLLLGEINLSIPFRGRGKGMEEGGRVTRE